MDFNNKNLSVQELLRDIADRSTELKASADELNYLAQRGFSGAGLSAADVNEVITRVNAKTFSLSTSTAVFIGGSIVILFSAALIWFTKNENKKEPVTEKKFEQRSELPVQTGPYQLNEVLIYSPEIRKNEEWGKEHFTSQSPEAPLEQAGDKIMAEEMPLKQTGRLAVNHLKEINFDQLPNAPVVYIEGLKVTNFHRYYFKADKQFELINGGFDAEFGDMQDYLSKRGDLKTEDKVTAVNVLRDAMGAFNAANYTVCIAELEVLLKINHGDVNALFYSGMSYYFLGKSTSAIECFDKVLSSQNNIFHQEAEYYKAVVLLQSGKKAEARLLMNKIIERGGFYAGRAKDMLEK